MLPHEFIEWMNELFAKHETLSFSEICQIKEKLKAVNSSKKSTIQLAKSGSMHWAPGAVYHNPNLIDDDNDDVCYGMGV